MKKNIILGLAASVAIAIGLSGCSDNYNELLEPLKPTQTLAIQVESSDYTATSHTLRVGAAPSSTVVKVTSNTRWIIEVENCDGGWCEVDRYSGMGNESFTISTAENLIEQRKCEVKIYYSNAENTKVGNAIASITVSQEVSDVRLSPSSVEPFDAESPRRQKFNILANSSWTLTVSYETGQPAEFITIHPLEGDIHEGSQGDNGKPARYTGTGDASFEIQLDPNNQAANRTATLTLESEVGKYSVDIYQIKSGYTFDVYPYQTQTISAEGGEIEFGILSLANWVVDTADRSWIDLSSNGGSASPQATTVRATIAPNLTGDDRYGSILFTPTVAGFEPVEVKITQTSYDYFFNVSPVGGLGTIPESGGSCEITINSSFNWEILVDGKTDTPDWLEISPREGYGTDRPYAQYVDVKVDPNTQGKTLSAIISVVPKETVFTGIGTVDPGNLGVKQEDLYIMQYGGREPAISLPWIVDNYSQTSITLAFNYYSPFYDIDYAGIEWRRVGDSDWSTEGSSTDHPRSGTVTVTISGLTPGTQYEARGFVEDSRTFTLLYGEVGLPFITAGQRPEEPDNPTPTYIKTKK